MASNWDLRKLFGCLSALMVSLTVQPLLAQSTGRVPIRQAPAQTSVPQQSYAQSAYRTSYPSASYGNYHSGYATAPSAPSYTINQVRTLAGADSSRQAQQDAVSLVPWQDLNSEGTRKIQQVIEDPSIFRRLPVTTIACDPQFFTFSIRNPETIVNMWQVFGVTTMGLQRTGPYTYAGNDGAGTNCTAELIYGDATRHIYVGTGTYEGPVFRRKITGRCVAILTTNVTGGANQYDLTNQLDVFIKVDNLAADLIAKTLTPLVGRTADHNFRESLTFLQAFSQTATHDPTRVSYLSQKLNVDPKTRTQFEQVVAGIQPRQQKYLSEQSDLRHAQSHSQTTR